MIKEEIEIFSDLDALYESFTEFIQKLLDVYPHLNLSLSGGNTPKALFDYWAENCKNSIDWSRITFYWGDERCVPSESEMSNYGVAKTHLFDKIPSITLNNIKRIHGENEPEEEAEWYSRKLTLKPLQRNNTPVFEVIMLGLGDDGHTASIFPNQMELWDDEDNCVVAEHPVNGINRISITGKVINNAQYVVFLVTGKSKARIVKDIIKNRKDFSNKYPAARVNPKNGYLYWFLDKEAASLL